MKSQNSPQVPEGFMRNRKGHLVEESMIDAYDLEMDAFVNKHIARAIEIQEIIRSFKTEVSEDCVSFQELLEEKYGAKLGGKKGGVSFTSYDGEHQIRISVQDRITMGPELRVAEKLLKECAHEWAQGARSEVKAIINDLFETNKEGDISVSKILEFRRDYKNISADERWIKGMEAIGDAIRVVGSKSYLNFKKRNPEGKYHNIPLDIAKL